MLRSAGLFVLASTSVACSSTDASHHGGRRVDLGRVPIEVVELYDLAATDGVIEIEVDRDGRVREMEADVPLVDVPAIVADAALRHLPAGRVTGAERELTESGAAWEVKLVIEGLAYEVVVDESGRILETERELDPRGVSPVVLATANAAVPGGVLRSVESIERGEALEYHVKKDLLGVTYKIVVGGDGGLLRTVREARAEIEIPVAPGTFERRTR
jgi:hypothetical protein